MSDRKSSEFGQRIRDYRRRRGWTQTHAAVVMGVQRTSLNRWEQGREMPSGRNMAKLCDHLRIPIGTSEDVDAPSEGRTYQLLLPFDQPLELELKVSPKRADTVQFQVQLKGVAS